MNKRLILVTVLLTIFLDFFNLGLIYPIFSSLIFEGTGGLFSSGASEFYKNAAFGVLIAVFPFGQLFGAPVIGELSDRYGRRKLLIFSLIGTVATLLLCAAGVYFSQIAILLIGRFIGGLMAGNVTLAYASLADFSSPEEKVKHFALVPFTMSAGFGLAPFLAGILADPASGSWAGPAIPFFAAAFFSMINLLLVWKKFPETVLKTKEKIKFSSFYSGLANLSKIFQPVPLRPYLWILFLMISANFVFVQFIGPFAIERFHISVIEVGYLYTNAGAAAALGNLFLTRYLAKYLSPEKALAGGLIALAVLLVAIAFSTTLIGVHIFTFLILLACAVAYTNSMAIVSNRSEEGKQGETMGIAVSIQSCSEFLPASVIGLIASASQNIPMLAAAFFSLLSYLILAPRLKAPIPE